LTEDNPSLVPTDDVDSYGQVLVDKIHPAAPPARSVPIPPRIWASWKPVIAALARKGRTLRRVRMRTRHTLDLARWRAVELELRKVNQGHSIMEMHTIYLLSLLFIASLNPGHFPSPWKRDLVTTVPKKGKDPCSPESYRPISLLSTSSKTFERIVLNRLLDNDTFNEALSNHQFCFRSRHSAIEQFYRVVNSHLIGFGIKVFSTNKWHYCLWDSGSSLCHFWKINVCR